MVKIGDHPLMKKIVEQHDSLTPKGRILGDYIMKNPRKVVFMTGKELAAACQVSEATVVRFVAQLDYDGYADFLQALRDLVDTEMTLVDRVDLSEIKKPGADRFRKMITQEIDNLKQLYKTLEMATVKQIVDELHASPAVYVIGSRLSYTMAYYMGWSLTKVRQQIHILKGSDSSSIDWLTIAPEGSLVVMIAISRYPNELIRIAKHVRRMEQKLVVIADSSVCPLIGFAEHTLVVPSRNIPMIGGGTGMLCLINYLTTELAGRYNGELKAHQEKLEQVYRENDILFNLEMPGGMLEEY